ncbi:MAG: YeeE/YedE family protein [Kofleriaceae bacterium]
MTPESALLAAIGGALIGIAAAIVLFVHGRIAGISGILGRALLDDDDGARRFRIAFLIGLLATGVVAARVAPHSIGPVVASPGELAIAGLLVGIGTTLANGCTSGHGVCGLSRLSRRSMVAVAVFMVTAMVTVAIRKAIG